MYLEYFGFREKPFSITPDPRFLFLSRRHREALAHLLYGIRNRSGFIEITGEVGTGKTTLLRTLLGELGEEGYRTAFIFNPRLSSLELLRSINHEFGIDDAGRDRSELLRHLNDFLLKENAAGRTVVLVVDEAQNLKPSVLEEIRLLSNLETESDKLIQIVLVGQPELGRLLGQKDLRQLRQRITVRYCLGTMGRPDTATYVGHRLEVAGAGARVRFTPAALRRIHRFAGGVPRLVNVLCDRALLIAYTREVRRIDRGLVGEAISELRRDRSWLQRGALFRVAGFFALGVLLVGLGLWGARFLEKEEGHVVTPPPAPGGSAVAPLPPPSAGSEDSTAARTLVGDLAALQEEESASLAFNPLARAWGVAPLRGAGEVAQAGGLGSAARNRALEMARYQGDLAGLIALGVPSLLEITLPGIRGKRFLALTGAEGDRVRTEGLPGGAVLLRGEDLESIWFGRAWVPWKNFEGIPFLSAPGHRGEGVEALQQRLRAAGFLRAETQKGVFDPPTLSAVTALQAAGGIAPDGRVGPLTLLVLYRFSEAVAVPALAPLK